MQVITSISIFGLLITHAVAIQIYNPEVFDQMSFQIYDPHQYTRAELEELKGTLFENNNPAVEPIYMAIYKDAVVGFLKIASVGCPWMFNELRAEFEWVAEPEDAIEGRHRLTKLALHGLRKRKDQGVLMMEVSGFEFMNFDWQEWQALYLALGFRIYDEKRPLSLSIFF